MLSGKITNGFVFTWFTDLMTVFREKPCLCPNEIIFCLFSSRMWNLEQNDNYILSVDGSGFEAGEVVNCISFNKVKGKTSKLIPMPL